MYSAEIWAKRANQCLSAEVQPPSGRTSAIRRLITRSEGHKAASSTLSSLSFLIPYSRAGLYIFLYPIDKSRAGLFFFCLHLNSSTHYQELASFILLLNSSFRPNKDLSFQPSKMMFTSMKQAGALLSLVTTLS